MVVRYVTRVPAGSCAIALPVFAGSSVSVVETITWQLLPYRKMKNILSKAYGAQVWGLYYSSDWKVDYFAWAVANLVGQAS